MAFKRGLKQIRLKEVMLLLDQHPLKVLVIDDEPATLTMFRLYLTAYGYEVLAAENGEAGVELVKSHQPDIVFTDLKMPGMDGFEVLKQVKSVAPKTEVIVITGHGDMDLVVQALNLDATDFINKPIKRSALEGALRRASERLKHPLPVTGTVSCSRDENMARIRIEGTLRRENRDQLIQCCQKVLKQADAAVLFQFMDNAAVDGSGIADLIKCLSMIRKNNQNAAVLGLSENFKVIFEMVGIARFAALYDSEEEALASLAKKEV